MGKISFTIGAGLLVRGMVRNSIVSLKQKILFEEPQANIKIEEIKSFLGSNFYVSVTDISNEMTQRLLDWYNESKKRRNKL